jgi:hypothetical protein
MLFELKFAPSGAVEKERKVHGKARKSVVEGVMNLIMFDQKARTCVIKGGKFPTVYNLNDPLFKVVTGGKYTLELTDIKMVHHLLTEPPNRALWFPKNSTETEAKERETVISIIAAHIAAPAQE